jgi:hypothetical protein
MRRTKRLIKILSLDKERDSLVSHAKLISVGLCDLRASSH